jgi:citrate lyase subunit beta/citryl-CoA lyase/(S)-citramalyl-CoA lyase
MSFRSLLFVPGNRPERFLKAKAAEPDAVCVDLEDAVPLHEKERARDAVFKAWLGGAHTPRPKRGVRINALNTRAGFEDVAALGEAITWGDFLMIPKAQSRIELENLRQALGEEDCPPLWPVVETAMGLEAAYEIAAAAGPEGGVLFGAADYSADVGCTMEWEALAYARGRLAAACAAAGAQLLDVPHLDVKDEAGLAGFSLRAKAMGFTGRACIHPDQVATVQAAFTPSAAEVERAQKVIAALDAASGAAALLDGKLIEKPVILAAKRVLARAGAN